MLMQWLQRTEKQVTDVLLYQDSYTYNEILKAKKKQTGHQDMAGSWNYAYNTEHSELLRIKAKLTYPIVYELLGTKTRFQV